jgi:hypothetical protein
MHCPRCGQQQVSEEIKFCSRCGFPLGLVSEILAQGGFLPQLADLHKSKKWLTRKNGIVFSILWFIFFVPFLTPIFGGVFNIEELGALCALIGVFGGLMIFIGSLVWLKTEPKLKNLIEQNESQKDFYQNLPRNKNQNVLPPPEQTHSAQSYFSPASSWKAPDTGELVRPGSVTEGTTKLLKKEE